MLVHSMLKYASANVQLSDIPWVICPATHTGKGKKLSSSVFHWVYQNKFLRVQGLCNTRILLHCQDILVMLYPHCAYALNAQAFSFRFHL